MDEPLCKATPDDGALLADGEVASCIRAPGHRDDHHSQYPMDGSGMVIGSARIWPNPQAWLPVGWCEGCHGWVPLAPPHYDRDGDHKAGAEFGSLGWLLACEKAVGDVRSALTEWNIGGRAPTPADLLALLPDAR